MLRSRPFIGNVLREAGHIGSQAGFLAFLYINPATGAGIVAAFNTDSDLPEGDQPDAFSRIGDQALELVR